MATDILHPRDSPGRAPRRQIAPADSIRQATRREIPRAV
jgi:hypothetical protein